MVADSFSRRPLANTISYIRNSLIDEIKAHYVDEIKAHYINDDVLKVLYEGLLKEARIIEEIEKFKSYELTP
jgi:hypothetical protein